MAPRKQRSMRALSDDPGDSLAEWVFIPEEVAELEQRLTDKHSSGVVEQDLQ
ncbi:hypothetical protein [Nocardia sp. NPDC019395]|uniref:hypothetical protein n=1 Tax=Nocardia sp. NPDC019395 TaxID=3154686 RepID=UPI0033E92BAD